MVWVSLEFLAQPQIQAGFEGDQFLRYQNRRYGQQDTDGFGCDFAVKVELFPLRRGITVTAAAFVFGIFIFGIMDHAAAFAYFIAQFWAGLAGDLNLLSHIRRWGEIDLAQGDLVEMLEAERQWLPQFEGKSIRLTPTISIPADVVRADVPIDPALAIMARFGELAE